MAERVPGSFRDPSGFVFLHEDRVFRAVDEQSHQLLRQLIQEEILSDLIEKKILIESSFVDQEVLCETFRREFTHYTHFLEHAPVPTITYPYEWTISMLADAGVLTLDFQLELLRQGYSLKDAAAYNCQFINGKPVAIDITSIERPERLDIWFALGQFLQMFLFPLLLCRYRHWDLRSYFLANHNGRQLEDVARSFTPWERLNPRLLLDVTFPRWLHRWSERRNVKQKPRLIKQNNNSDSQRLNLQRLRRKTRKLADSYTPHGLWADYAQICNYSEKADQHKRELVGDFLAEVRPHRVLDLGCNTGEYSRLAINFSNEVIATDSDHDAVEVLYRQLRANPVSITPMVTDLANPSPGIGFMNQERSPFLKRVQSDCVLALALIHHLIVAGNMSLEAVRDFLFAVSTRDILMEFIPHDDSMFQRLLRSRRDLYDRVSLDACREVFRERFEICRETLIADSKRKLIHLRKK